ncbi:glucosaminidase domain-containing protein [Enterococcus sp. LJL90]
MKKILGITSIIAILFPIIAAPTSAFASETADSPTETETAIQAPAKGTPEIEPPVTIEETETPDVTPPAEETDVPETSPVENNSDNTSDEVAPPVEEETTTLPEDATENPVQEPTQAAPTEEIPPVTEAPVTAEQSGVTAVAQSPTSEVVETPTQTTVEVPSNSATITYNRNLTTEQFVLTIGEQAREVGQERDIYASVMIAQAILESGSGSSDLASPPNYNLFGIKGEYNGNSVSYATQEDDGTGNLYTTQASFKVYGNYQESLADYATLLTDGVSWNNQFYAGTWKTNTTSYQDATTALEGSYATDTSYAEKLNGLIETYNLSTYDEPLVLAEDETEDTQAVKTEALQYLGIPYVWGGTTPTGFDCSGLVQYVYQHAVGMDLPRVTTDQEHVGTEVSLTALRTGDLVFFGERGNTHHVGIYIGNGQFIHAPQTGDVVKITNLSDFTPDFAKRLLE